jgi:hypothetical protein
MGYVLALRCGQPARPQPSRVLLVLSTSAHQRRVADRKERDQPHAGTYEEPFVASDLTLDVSPDEISTLHPASPASVLVVPVPVFRCCSRQGPPIRFPPNLDGIDRVSDFLRLDDDPRARGPNGTAENPARTAVGPRHRCRRARGRARPSRLRPAPAACRRHAQRESGHRNGKCSLHGSVRLRSSGRIIAPAGSRCQRDASAFDVGGPRRQRSDGKTT